MFMVVPTWVVTVSSGLSGELHDPFEDTFRVSETNLSEFLKVLVFNKREFTVNKEKRYDQVTEDTLDF